MTGAKWNQEELEQHLASAVHTLTPEVWSRLDLSTPQQFYTMPLSRAKGVRRRRLFRTAAAACLCAAVLGSGLRVYVNQRVESVIGLDVNPSIELSVNRKERVLRVTPLNQDAESILDDMDLKGVQLEIAVNALVGSMVRNGYLTDWENAILVTVSNENREKAAVLRQDVVLDLEESLRAHQVQAVVYDQQVPEKDEVRELAESYHISYGKAYFLQELVEENGLTQEELTQFSQMTMEEIAGEIAARSYVVRSGREPEALLESETEDPKAVSSERPEPESFPEETKREKESLEAGETEIGAEFSDADRSVEELPFSSPKEADGLEKTMPEESKTEASRRESNLSADGFSEPESTEGEASEEENHSDPEDASAGKKAKIDYVDYENGVLDVVFEEKVKWKNPTVSVQDDTGQSYAAKLTDTASDSCAILVRGLPSGAECSFTLAGVAVKGGKHYESIRGYFETPEISEEAEPNDPDWDPEEDSDGEISEEERSEPKDLEEIEEIGETEETTSEDRPEESAKRSEESGRETA